MDRGTHAVLRVADQQRDVAPDRCVKSGVRTDGAVRLRAYALRRAPLWQAALGPAVRFAAAVLRRPSVPVVLPVSPSAWWRVQRTMRRAMIVAGLGLGSLCAGLLQGEGVLLVLGALLLVLAWGVRLVGLQRWWVGVRLTHGGDVIRVSRVSPEFERAARALFVRSILGSGQAQQPD